MDVPECAVCGRVAPLTEEMGAVLRLLVDDTPYEAKSYDEVFVHARCFKRVTPWRGIESDYDPVWRDRSYRLAIDSGEDGGEQQAAVRWWEHSV